MNTEKPLVSIVLSTYNGSRYIRESIQSCLSQSYKNIELIIVDDCSTDNTADIIQEMSVDKRIRYIKNSKNLKLPNSLNVGFANSKGDFLTWTSDDNLYLSNAIERMVSFLLDNKHFSFVFSDYMAFGNGYEKPVHVQSGWDLSRGNCIGASFMYHREIYEKLGGYSDKLRLAEDYDYWLRVNLNFSIGHIPELLYKYRQHESSLTSSNFYLVLVMGVLTRLKNGVISEEQYLQELHYILLMMHHGGDTSFDSREDLMTNAANCLKFRLIFHSRIASFFNKYDLALGKKVENLLQGAKDKKFVVK